MQQGHSLGTKKYDLDNPEEFRELVDQLRGSGA